MSCIFGALTVYGLTVLICCQLLYAYQASKDMGGPYQETFYMTYLVWSLVPGIVLGTFAILVRKRALNGEPQNDML